MDQGRLRGRKGRRRATAPMALLPLLGMLAVTGVLAVPGVRDAAMAKVDWYTYVWGIEAFEPVDTRDPVAAPGNPGVGVGWGTSVWPQQPTAVHPPVRPPAPPARPPLPTLPWDRQTERSGVSLPEPVQTLGPVLRITTTVAPFGFVTIPPGGGQPHVLCPGPTTPGVVYWLDSTTAAGTRVHRADGSGVFDFFYRTVTEHYRQTAPCS